MQNISYTNTSFSGIVLGNLLSEKGVNTEDNNAREMICITK